VATAKIIGTVIETRGGVAVVELRDRGGCSRCAHSRLCGNTGGPDRLEALNTLKARSGKRVVVAVAERDVFRYTLCLYGLPLLFFLLGAVAGHLLAGPGAFPVSADAAAAIGAFSLLFVTFVILKIRLRKVTAKRDIQPQIVDILADDMAACADPDDSIDGARTPPA